MHAHMHMCTYATYPLMLLQVSSTETGVIFGNLVFEGTGYADRNVVVLNDIHIDIMDYISPASCPDVNFRNMWAEFEWENSEYHWGHASHGSEYDGDFLCVLA